MTEKVTKTTKRSFGRDVALRILDLGVVVVVLWLLFTRLVSWSDVAEAIADLDWGDWAWLVAVSAIRIAIEPLLLMAATPRLRWPKALPGFLAPAAAASVVPGPSDLAARYAMFRSWGYSGAQTSASVMLVFLHTTFAKVALPFVAALLFLAFGRSNAQLETLAVIAVGVLIGGVLLIFLLLRPEKTARRLAHAVGVAAQRVASWFRIKTPGTLAADPADRAAHFRDRTGDVVRTRTPLAASAAALGRAGLFAILLVSVRVVGIHSGDLDWAIVGAPRLSLRKAAPRLGNADAKWLRLASQRPGDFFAGQCCTKRHAAVGAWIRPLISRLRTWRSANGLDFRGAAASARPGLLTFSRKNKLQRGVRHAGTRRPIFDAHLLPFYCVDLGLDLRDRGYLPQQ